MVITLAVSAGTHYVLTMLGGKGEGQRKVIARGPWCAGSKGHVAGLVRLSSGKQCLRKTWLRELRSECSV